MSVKDGGPAFPALDVEHFPAGYGHAEHTEVTGLRGMSLRDYFAGQALPAVMAEYFKANGSCLGVDHAARSCAVHAHRYADALIAALEKE